MEKWKYLFSLINRLYLGFDDPDIQADGQTCLKNIRKLLNWCPDMPLSDLQTFVFCAGTTKIKIIKNPNPDLQSTFESIMKRGENLIKNLNY